MGSRIVTISFTSLDAPGGVPKFNRDLHAAFSDRECKHFSWWDFPWYPEVETQNLTEWEKARVLNNYLVSSKNIGSDDTVVADGFWADGLQHINNAISHSHGIWSHLTHDDVLANKRPENPYHHAAQVSFRQMWTASKKHITAVSDFIAHEMKLQWGFEVDRVINNGVDTELFKPLVHNRYYSNNPPHPLIIHGVNDRGNENKGWAHIEYLEKNLPVNVMSLDEVYQSMMLRSDHQWTKAEALAQADLVVHPSGYEGNSMFVAEALACGVPFVGYDVGFAHTMRKEGMDVGWVLTRAHRSPKDTMDAVKTVLSMDDSIIQNFKRNARTVAVENLSLDKFICNWREYIGEVESGT